MEIQTFDEYWNSVKPDTEVGDKETMKFIALQKSAARCGWDGAMMQLIKFLEYTKAGD